MIECVPNFSEGRDQRVIRSISEAISQVEGIQLLHVDPSPDANRTVMTFVGELEPVGEAAFKAISRAAELIDMQLHRGAHPRLGAADVCPFVPLAGLEMTECIRLARIVGQRVGEELGLPVYLYGSAASRPERHRLAAVRRGELEGLPEKLADPDWQPDFGPPVVNLRTGAVAVGARGMLIALNVNLNTTDVAVAAEVAGAIRERGSVERDENGNIRRDAAGNPLRRPGALRACRAMGWFMPAYGCAQVSMNLEDFRETPPHAAYEEVRLQASELGLEATGCELVGMIPLEAVLMAGRYYAEKEGGSSGVSGEELVAAAVRGMDLSALKEFRPEERIIEYRLRREGGPWAEWAEHIISGHETEAARGQD